MATKVIERNWGMEQKIGKRAAAAAVQPVESFWEKVRKFFWRPSRLTNDDAILRAELRAQARLQRNQVELSTEAARCLRKIV